MNFSNLKFLFVQNEIKKVKERIEQYEEIYNNGEIKDLTLRRLISVKQRELNILETIFKENPSNDDG